MFKLAVIPLLLTCLALTPTSARASGVFADTVVSYTEGTGAGTFNNPNDALGEPTRITDPGGTFGGPVTPFASAFGSGELVTIGEGGQLTVSFSSPVVDDPLNPFGIDLLVFGNAFLFDADFPNGIVQGPLFSEGGIIEVSANGTDFFTITGIDADGSFPTLGFNDPTAANPSDLTDFTRPVDPSFTFNPGDTLNTIIAGYNGSGGGAGIDLATVGLSEISFVRISNPIGSGVTPEIDGFADVTAVPEPSCLALVGVAGVSLVLRRRRR